MQYVILKNNRTKNIEVLGRFVDDIAEIYKDGKWQFESYLYSWQIDGLLTEITETEAIKIIAELEATHLQVA